LLFVFVHDIRIHLNRSITFSDICFHKKKISMLFYAELICMRLSHFNDYSEISLIIRKLPSKTIDILPRRPAMATPYLTVKASSVLNCTMTHLTDKMHKLNKRFLLSVLSVEFARSVEI